MLEYDVAGQRGVRNIKHKIPNINGINKEIQLAYLAPLKLFREGIMKKFSHIIMSILLVFTANICWAFQDSRQLVNLPEMMQEHMMANMRDHLAAINEILGFIANDELDRAANVAETRLGMSSLEAHGAGHMANFMPEGMQKAGTSMHRAASRFALKVEEGETLKALDALAEVTSACVACHMAYRIR